MEETLNGALVIDKPAGWTSHDVVAKVRRISGTKKVGHLGTLDPLATGVLPLLLGKATRLAQYFSKSTKRYDGVVRFGVATDTYDAAGKPLGPEAPVSLARNELERALEHFRGKIMQTPPPVSAKKIQGTPAYKLARRNAPVELQPVEVEIFDIQLLHCENDDAELSVHCSSGTYLRSIAHDLGIMLGYGAHLKSLRRTASGPFEISRALTIERTAEMAADGALVQALIPGAELLPEFPNEIVDIATAGFIRQGRDFRVSPFTAREARLVKAVTGSGELVAIGEVRLPGLYHPILVL